MHKGLEFRVLESGTRESLESPIFGLGRLPQSILNILYHWISGLSHSKTKDGSLKLVIVVDQYESREVKS